MAIRNMQALGLRGVTGHFVGADEEYLVALEEDAGFPVPVEYKEFLRRYGASLFASEVWFRPLVASPLAVNGVESFDLF